MKKYKINVMKWNLEKYNTTPLFYQKFQILLLMENANTHLVSIFKDYLLYDDSTEFFKEYYIKKEIYPRLKTIYDYYESSSYLFPNYTAINEGKYIYRNIIQKQKLIDYIEDLEDKMKEKEEKKNLKKKKKLKNNIQNEQSSSSFIDVFDTKIYENIRKETENDSKINELFCVGNKNNNELDSFSSILKLAEELKENNSEIKDKNNINKNNDNKLINSATENRNEAEWKIFVSKKIDINKNPKIYNKKTINKGNKNTNINNFINSNKNGLITRNEIVTEQNKNNNQVNLELSKNNDFIKNNQNNLIINKNLKNNYKKNNIIINIINNNKNNNYNYDNNYFQNYNNINTYENNNNNNNKYFYSYYITTNINNNQRRNTDKNIKNNNFIINENIDSKRIFSKPQSTNNNKYKINKNQIKSKLLSFKLTDTNFIENLTERIKNKSNSNSMKKNKNKSLTKSIFSPVNKNISKNMKKRTKTEVLGYKTDIFILGKQSENISCNKSINRQILKNINLTNNKPHKEMSLVNKKIVNNQLNTNNNSNNNKKKTQHISTNSQNLTDINKIAPISTRETIKKNIVTTVFSVNKTERTSRNHSKDKMNIINNTTIKKNYLDSFSPKKSQDLIYNKIHRIRNQKNDTVYSFLKSINSNKRTKEIKGKIGNYSNINNTYYKGINNIRNYREMLNRIHTGKNI